MQNRIVWSLGAALIAALMMMPAQVSAQDAVAARTIWDGVYTEAQADRGKLAYKACTKCHGSRLNGAPDDPDRNATPPLARSPFLRDWTGRNIQSLFAFTKMTMPQNNPGYLPDQDYVDIIAYMLSMSDAPAGEEELPLDPDALTAITIEPKP